MNFAAVQRFAPFLSLADRKSGTLTEPELQSLANAIGGQHGDAWFGLFSLLSKREPNTLVSQLLGLEEAGRLVRLAKDKVEEHQAAAPDVAFIRCPLCEGRFETELS